MHFMVLVVQVDLSEKLVRIFLQCGREVARAAATPCNASLLAYTFFYKKFFYNNQAQILKN